MIKITIQEERYVEEFDDHGGKVLSRDKTHLVTVHEAQSEDRIVLAALLRGMADRWDPPPKFQ